MMVALQWEALKAMADRFAAMQASFDTYVADLRAENVSLQERLGLAEKNASVLAEKIEKIEREKISNRIVDLAEKLEQLRHDQTLPERIADLAEKIDNALSKQVDFEQFRHDQTLPERIADLSEKIEHIANDNTLSEQVINLSGKIDANKTIIDHISASIEERISAIANKVKDDNSLTIINDRIDTISEHVNRVDEKLNNSLKIEERLVNIEADDRLDRMQSTSEQIIKMFADITQKFAKTPRRFAVNSDGNLIAVDAEGDLKDLGKVFVSIQDVRLTNNRLELTMSDGRRIDAGEIVINERKPDEPTRERSKAYLRVSKQNRK